MDCILAPKAQESTVTALSNESWGEQPHLVNHWILTNPPLTSIFFQSDCFQLDYAQHITWHRWRRERKGRLWLRSRFSLGIKSFLPPAFFAVWPWASCFISLSLAFFPFFFAARGDHHKPLRVYVKSKQCLAFGVCSIHILYHCVQVQSSTDFPI